MRRIQRRFAFLTGLGCLLLSSCLGEVWTGANLVYDRHDVYKTLNDYHLFVDINNALYPDNLLRCRYCILDVAVFNGDILIAGHLPSTELEHELRRRLTPITGYKHLFIEVAVQDTDASSVTDSWITTKIRSQIFADDSIDPHAFKVVTADRSVYLMGDVDKKQADKVINMARFTSGVKRVVTLMRYITYQ